VSERKLGNFSKIKEGEDNSAILTNDYFSLLKETGLREKYYVVVGGGPITPDWTTEIGADGTSRTATIELLKRVVTEGVPPPLPQSLIIGY